MRAALAISLLIGGAALAAPPEPEGFRGEPYKAPVPATLSGAQAVDTAQALMLHDKGAIFIDVYPRTSRPENLPAGTVWRDPVHMTIPGAIWLYDTGYEHLAPPEGARLAQGLDRATASDKSREVVFFCRADCWMSWNAAKRALALGYSAVIWFPDGTDGWEAEGRDLVPARPDEPAEEQ